MQIGASVGSSANPYLSQLSAKLRSALDTDKSNSLSATELSAAGSTSATASSASSLLTSMDSNGDGSVSQDEILSYLQNMLSPSTLSGLTQAQSGDQPPQGGPGGSNGVQTTSGGFTPPSFSDIDSNGDGSISQAEMEAYGASQGATGTTRADKLFAAMDTNGDGTVSADEKTAFDSQMASKASGHHHHHHGGPPPADGTAGTDGTATTTTASAATDGTSTDSGSTSPDSSSSESLANLMQQFMTALQSYASTSAASAATSAGTASLSIAA